MSKEKSNELQNSNFGILSTAGTTQDDISELYNDIVIESVEINLEDLNHFDDDLVERDLSLTGPSISKCSE